jgi:hypothetical protein
VWSRPGGSDRLLHASAGDAVRSREGGEPPTGLWANGCRRSDPHTIFFIFYNYLYYTRKEFWMVCTVVTIVYIFSVRAVVWCPMDERLYGKK